MIAGVGHLEASWSGAGCHSTSPTATRRPPGRVFSLSLRPCASVARTAGTGRRLDRPLGEDEMLSASIMVVLVNDQL